MAKHWAIIIGINQYQSLQPLMYAQQDAVELRNFFVAEAGLPAEQCLLITDALVDQEDPAYPSREFIQSSIEDFLSQLTTEDTLWFFFSGYGVAWEGQDFLLPIDADPLQIHQTGVAIQSLLEQLKAAPTENVIVALDINRSQGAATDQRLGIQSQELAKSLEIATLLSCQPEQFSQETLAVHHGFFTAALLEAMRYHGCLTVSQLATYVGSRVPALCQHHLRPIQNPVAVFPPQGEYLLVIPPEATSRLPLTQAASYSTETTVQSLSLQEAAGDSLMSDFQPDSPTSKERPLLGHAAGDAADLDRQDAEEEGEEEAVPPSWQRWTLLAAGVLLVGVFIRNQAVFTGNSASEATDAASPAEVSAPEDAADIDTTSSEEAGAEELLFSSTPEAETGKLLPLEQARIALGEGRYGEALTWLEQVPLAQRDATYGTLLEQAQSGSTQAEGMSPARMAEAQLPLQELTVTPFVEAMVEAQQVPPEDPYYGRAQAAVERWGQVVLDVADAQALAGNFVGAIATARQIPNSQSNLYNTAQQRIAVWQQRRVNLDVLKQAQERLVPDQASTFRDSIDLVAPISSKYPEYATAQERILGWSEDILAIARTRAAQGDLQGAIEAAMLVPEQTPVYQPAQEQIQQWRAQLESGQ